MTKKQFLYSFLTIAMMVFIFVQSSLPADLSSAESSFAAKAIASLFHLDWDTAQFVVRKTAHFLEYLVLGILLFLSNSEWLSSRMSTLKPAAAWAFVLALAIGIAYAVSDEFHQRFALGRSCEARDVLIDAAGVLTGTVILTIFHFSRKNRSKNA